MPYHHGRRRLAVRAAAVTGCASLLGALAVAGATPGFASTAKPLVRVTQHDQGATSCGLGHGVKHVIELTFDNVHFFRDNPNVPSDLQMMPSLLHFLENNGTFASNNHTPLIAHTADDLLTTFTGLYGDRAGMPVSNSYRTFNTDGTDPIRLARSPTGPIRSSTPRRRRTRATTPTRPWSTRPARPPPRSPRRSRTPPPPHPGCRSPGPAATSARRDR